MKVDIKSTFAINEFLLKTFNTFKNDIIYEELSDYDKQGYDGAIKVLDEYLRVRKELGGE